MIRRILDGLGIAGLFGLATLALVIGLAVSDQMKPGPVFAPGTVVDHVVNAGPGDPRHHMRSIVESVEPDGGYRVSVRMPEVGVDGFQTVTFADDVAGRCLRGRSWSGDNSQAGCFSWIKASKAFFRDLKSGRSAELQYRDSSDTVDSLKVVRRGRVVADFNNRPMSLPYLLARTSDGWSLSFHDDEAFPFVTDGLEGVWTPDAMGKALLGDLSGKGRVSTRAILFDANAAMDPASADLVDRVAVWFKARPKVGVRVYVKLDDTLGREARIAAAGARADAIAARLTAAGIAPARIQAVGLAALGPGPRGGFTESVEFIAIKPGES